MPCWFLLPEPLQPDDDMPTWFILRCRLEGTDRLSVWHVLESASADVGIRLRSVHSMQLRLAGNIALHVHGQQSLPNVFECANVRNVHWSCRLRLGLQQRILRRHVHPLLVGILVL